MMLKIILYDLMVFFMFSGVGVFVFLGIAHSKWVSSSYGRHVRETRGYYPPGDVDYLNGFGVVLHYTYIVCFVFGILCAGVGFVLEGL